MTATSEPDSSRPSCHRPISILVDDREARGPVLESLTGADTFAIEVGRLDVGDYLIDHALLFERKTLSDLVVSIKDGRLFKQASRLAESGLAAAIILEGNPSELNACRMRWEAIQGALATVSLFIGVPILRTRNANETARTLAFAGRQRRNIDNHALPRRGKRPKNKFALQQHILQGLPGIGPDRAARLLRRFGSIRATMTADVDALTEVYGIGHRTAQRMRWAVEECHG